MKADDVDAHFPYRKKEKHKMSDKPTDAEIKEHSLGGYHLAWLILPPTGRH
jgi:hypothetical protein